MAWKAKELKGIWFKSPMPSLQMKIAPQTLTWLEFSGHAASSPPGDNRNAPHSLEIYEEKGAIAQNKA